MLLDETGAGGAGPGIGRRAGARRRDLADRELGAGKTTFARGLLRGLGAVGEVNSPSYGLVHRHATPQGAAYHVDCYRLHQPDEAQDLDWGTISTGRALIIEWPERAGVWAPPATCHVQLSHADDPACRLVDIR